MPYARVSEPVRVRIASQDVRRNVGRKIPPAFFIGAGGEHKINRSEITGMVAFAGADQHRNKIAHLQGKVLEGPYLHFFTSLSCARSQSLTRRTSAHFQ